MVTHLFFPAIKWEKYLTMALARSLMLPQEQQHYLLSLVRRGKTAAQAITRAHVLLHCGKGEDAHAIARRFGLCARTVYAFADRELNTNDVPLAYGWKGLKMAWVPTALAVETLPTR